MWISRARKLPREVPDPKFYTNNSNFLITISKSASFRQSEVVGCSLLLLLIIVSRWCVDGAAKRYKSGRTNKRACHCWCSYRIRGEYGARRMRNKFPYATATYGVKQPSEPWTAADANRAVLVGKWLTNSMALKMLWLLSLKGCLNEKCSMLLSHPPNSHAKRCGIDVWQLLSEYFWHISLQHLPRCICRLTTFNAHWCLIKPANRKQKANLKIIDTKGPPHCFVILSWCRDDY